MRSGCRWVCGEGGGGWSRGGGGVGGWFVGEMWLLGIFGDEDAGRWL